MRYVVSTMKKILILEDDFDLGMAWKIQLEQFGHDVVLVSDPDDAIDELSTLTVDLLISDILIRDHDGALQPSGGLTVLTHVALDLASKPKVIAVSGASFDVLRHAKTLQADRVMKKPLSVDSLSGAVEELLAAS